MLIPWGGKELLYAQTPDIKVETPIICFGVFFFPPFHVYVQRLLFQLECTPAHRDQF